MTLFPPRELRRLTYLASPYWHDNLLIRAQRVEAASKTAYSLLNQGRLVFSPIAHSATIAQSGPQIEHSTWMDLDLSILRACTDMLVLTLPGWKGSRGVAEEIDYCRREGIPWKFLSQNMDVTDYPVE